jgi:radical SAM protein with 4Fe4S-binding SPASM domain
MGCNMNCGHCGSSCKYPLPGELTSAEALSFVDMCVDMNLKWVTLSGGEPLTRSDICSIIKYCKQKGLAANIITNGWLMTDDLAKKLKSSGVSTVAISLDGTEEVHDKIRKKGSFERIKNAFHILKKYDIFTASITTISNLNIALLGEIKDFLISMGVDVWQLQIGLPMGNFSKHPDWLIKPDKIIDIIDFCYDAAVEGKIGICLADCMGYYSRKQIEIDKIYLRSKNIPLWDGCHAGIRSFGMLHNGDILGCTSIRDKKFIEGNIREKTLREIWESPDTFLWRRNFTKEMLDGNCKVCKYSKKCLGGCTNTRLAINKDINSDNKYCTHSILMDKFRNQLASRVDSENILNHAKNMINQKCYQEANLSLDRLIELEPENSDFKNLKNFTHSII